MTATELYAAWRRAREEQAEDRAHTLAQELLREVELGKGDPGWAEGESFAFYSWLQEMDALSAARLRTLDDPEPQTA